MKTAFNNPPKVVVDTNVVISAIISSYSSPVEIFKMIIRGEIINYTSPKILEELKACMDYEKIRKITSFSKREMVLSCFSQYSIIISSPLYLPALQQDPDDTMILECAVAARAAYIITKDHHLLDLNSFLGIQIITPAAFLQRFRC